MLQKVKESKPVYNPTRSVWWRSQNRTLSLRSRAVILTRASHQLMTLPSRITGLVYMIPIGSIVTLLLIASSAFALTWQSNNFVYAEESITPTADAPSASLGIANPTLTGTGEAGEVVYASNDITVRAELIESYNLQLFGASTLDGPTTILATTTDADINDLKENTWGYAWDSASKYSGISTTPITIANDNIDASGTVNYTKPLHFAVRFGMDAQVGHYKTDINLSLTATPKLLSAIWQNTGSQTVDSGITSMQEMTNKICNQVEAPNKTATNLPTLTLYDQRDRKYYDISKMPDGTCWMVQNLRYQIKADEELNSSNSNVRANWIPTSSEATQVGGTPVGFSESDIYEVKSWADGVSNPDGVGVYYNWYAATAKSGSSSINSGVSVESSICPKNWKLPLRTDYQNLLTAAGIGNNAAGGAKILSYPYQFKLGGYIEKGEIKNTDGAYYWTSLGYDRLNAIAPTFTETSVGIFASGRFAGFSVRCVLDDTRTLNDITTMQEMTTKICANTPISPQQYELEDIRDGVKYNVAKLADNRCWMTQNLRLTKEGMTAKGVAALTAQNSDVNSNYTLNASSKTGFNSNSGQNVFYDNNASYGAYYTWCAATAGCKTTSGSTVGSSGNVAYSICPLGWRLPTNNEYQALINASGLATDSAAGVKGIKGAPYFFTPAGWMYNGDYGNVDGVYGNYWSSTAQSSTSAYILNFSDSVIAAQGNLARSVGGTMRCLAK